MQFAGKVKYEVNDDESLMLGIDPGGSGSTYAERLDDWVRHTLVYQNKGSTHTTDAVERATTELLQAKADAGSSRAKAGTAAKREEASYLCVVGLVMIIVTDGKPKSNGPDFQGPGNDGTHWLCST